MQCGFLMPGGDLLAAMDFRQLGANLWSILLLVVGFSLVIFVHELGHFLAAKWARVRVERFAIGFGKELFGFTRGETRYSFNILPLGGYVKMLGQEDFVVDKSGELKVKADPDSFTHKSIGQRMVIVSAGVIMNLLFAAVAFAIVIMAGRDRQPPVVGDVAPNSPAARAGLQSGDRVVAINGKEIHSFEEFQFAVMLSDVDEQLTLDVERGGKMLDPKPVVLPEFKKDQKIRQIGISNGRNRRVAIPSVAPSEVDAPDRLRQFDELYQLVLPNGEPKEFKDPGVFSRALIEARGKPVEFIVKRPKDAASLTPEAVLGHEPALDTIEARVKVQAVWSPMAYEEGDQVTGSLLGLVPRLSIRMADEKKSFEAAGAQFGDVIARIGGEPYPSYALVRKIIEENPGKPVELAVSRPGMANHGLSAATIALLVEHRESLIATALKDLAAAASQVSDLAQKRLPEADAEKLKAAVAKLADGTAWRKWLENVDVHVLQPLVPRANFALIGKAPPPAVDAMLRTMDESHLVVADVVAKYGTTETPAHAAGVPVGAVITAVDGKPVRQWYELSEAFRAAAGRTVEVTCRAADLYKTVKLDVPGDICAALEMPQGSRIARIDNQTEVNVTDTEGNLRTLSLPDWRAVRELLKKSVGKTVPVEYVTLQAERRAGTFAVTESNTDPWLLRVQYQDSFMCYPLIERYSESNPILAMTEGFRQAYMATLQTILSIQHMVFTQQVGVEKVSGPVGIIRIGSKAADAGIIGLLWFLAVISANLAVINFLPMPIVDGGLFLFLILEKIRGEPVSIKTQVATQLIGIALIATLFILVTYQDIKNWILGA